MRTSPTRDYWGPYSRIEDYELKVSIMFGRTTQWFLVLRKISSDQTTLTNPHQKPLSDDHNLFQMTERRGAGCYV
jgi:hypothetical protein